MAPCSNGNIALMADLKRRNNLPWDAILGSEIAQGYKPGEREPKGSFDIVGKDFHDFANKLGV